MQRRRLKRFFKGCDWREFERFVAEFWARGGWRVQLTDARGDGGIDVYLEHPTAEYTIGIEVMRHSRDALSGRDVKDVFFRQQPNTFTDVFCLLSTTEFNKSAKTAAQTVGCDLIGLQALSQAVDEADDVVLADQYDAGNGWVETEEDVLDRLGALNRSISPKARSDVIASEWTDAILYTLETMDDPPPVFTEAHVSGVEKEIARDAPVRSYPVRGGYAPAWQSGRHPAATQSEPTAGADAAAEDAESNEPQDS